MKGSYTPLIFPLTAMGGVIACHIWKWRGVAFFSAFLAMIMIYSLQQQSSQSWLWIIALSLSIASTFVVTVLCSEEANHAVEALNKDSCDHKQTLLHLNERYLKAQNKLIAEQNELNLQVNKLQEQLSEKEEKQHSNEQLIRLARHEITTTFVKQEKMLQQLSQLRQENAENEMRIEELQELVNPDTVNLYGKVVVQGLQGKLEAAHEIINSLSSVKESLEYQVDSLQQKLEGFIDLEDEKLLLLNKLATQNEIVDSLLCEKENVIEQYESLQKKHKDFMGLDHENQTLLQKLAHQNELVASLSLENKNLSEKLDQLSLMQQELSETTKNDKELRRVEGLYIQLKEQFAEKSEVLTSTRRALFITQEKLLVLQKDREEEKIDDDKESTESLRRLIAAAESELALVEHQHVLEVNRLHEVIESLMVQA